MEVYNTITNILISLCLDVIMICGIVIVCIYTVELIKEMVASSNKKIREINSRDD